MVTGGTYRRRAVLAALASAGAIGAAPAVLADAFAGQAPSIVRGAAPRLAAIDWAMMETAVALGHVPVAGCELIRFRADAIDPPLPDSVTDLGLRGAPNFELLQLVGPDLILSSPYYTRHAARLQGIAPVLSLTFFEPGVPPLPRAMVALRELAQAIDAPAAGDAATARTEAAFDALARRAQRFADRPVMLIDMGDARHFRAFGADSLYGSTLQRIGLANGWTEGTRFSFAAPVPLDRLADIGDARFVLVSPVPLIAAGQLHRSALWNALPEVRAGRVLQLEPSNPFGAVPAALRFASLLIGALEAA
ncbi:MAG: amino acid ABC transporter substrate-binding protein [Rhodobacteraceae bacterium GWE1_64_9]|nr:MAG: amino acid ABC transporter substrate-binding protein [Rhodobacteraceae bacterium GWE1_64_9]OHC48870.1 MAG: amino acid ABC transporter substrate-binding protein [Rhodobacteraceae bacterium GWF1_65_7]HBD91120.1 amino acid ABC transporter substrate-binding protein [Gemmobacter sp.]HBU15918.1 amino acid ABC transporter substrate-binding protein [Gemmobacter sp.]